MPEDLQQGGSGEGSGSRERKSGSGPGQRRRRSSRGRSGSGRSSSSSSAKKHKFTFGQFVLLVWSAVTLGGFMYVMQDVHRVPLWMPLALAGMAFVGLYFFFSALIKKKGK